MSKLKTMKRLLLISTLFIFFIFELNSQTPVNIVSWPLTTDLNGIANYPGITPHAVELGSGVISEGVNQTICSCTGLRTRDWNQATSINTSQSGGHWVQFSFTNNGAAPIEISRFGFSASAGTSSACNLTSAMAVRWSIDNVNTPSWFALRSGACSGELLYNIGSTGCTNYAYHSTNTGHSGTCTSPFSITLGVGQRIRFRVIIGSTRHNTDWKVVIGNVFVERISPLSVTLNEFNANCESNGTTINWSTASEQNASHFDLERSNDGETWNNVTTVLASGNSTSLKTYSAKDNVRPTDGRYYRLRQVDFDGKEEIHGPITVNCNNSQENSLLVFPNPSSGEFAVEINSNEVLEDAAVVVYDLSGKQLMRQVINSNLKGTNMVYFSENKLAPGTYLVVIESEARNNFTPVKLVIR